MLIRAFEVVNGEKVDLIEGNYPNDHLGDLQIGTTIPLTGIRPNPSLIGSTQLKNQNETISGLFVIKDRRDNVTEIGVPFVELDLIRVV